MNRNDDMQIAWIGSYVLEHEREVPFGFSLWYHARRNTLIR